MKQTLIILSVLLCANFSQAQDIITKNDSTKVQAVVLEINPTQLKYKLFNYPDGPLITESKTQIAYIIFKNGLAERFPKEAVIVAGYDPNAYNLDKVPVKPYDPEARLKKYEALYRYRNYIGFNYLSLLNASLGFNYMRDIKKAHLIIHVPVGIGLGRPVITNGLYGRVYLDGTGTTKYEKMNYQVGISPLFTPSMKSPVNFLIGPSYTFTEYRISVASVWRNYNQPTVQFNNEFRLYRSYYGINTGMMVRYTSHFNMSLLLTMGFIQDTYSEKDPYGLEMLKNTYHQEAGSSYYNNNALPYYVNLHWTLGYRF